MDNEEVEKAMRGFGAVWQRVNARGEDGGGNAADNVSLFQSLIQTEADAQRIYQSLSMQCSGKPREKLSYLVLESRLAEKSLQQEYFCLMGDTYAVQSSHVVEAPFLTMLRETLLREQQSKSAYLAAAAQTDSELLRLLFGDLAAKRDGRIKLLKVLIAQALG